MRMPVARATEPPSQASSTTPSDCVSLRRECAVSGSTSSPGPVAPPAGPGPAQNGTVTALRAAPRSESSPAGPRAGRRRTETGRTGTRPARAARLPVHMSPAGLASESNRCCVKESKISISYYRYRTVLKFYRREYTVDHSGPEERKAARTRPRPIMPWPTWPPSSSVLAAGAAPGR